jgi:nicotinamidase/pyrazinamidase
MRGDRIIFWDVDTQVDFIHPQGKLYVPGAEKLIPNWKRLTDWAAAHGVLILGHMDVHQEDDPEFRLYPPHCLAGTPGHEKIPETVLPRQHRIPNRKVDLPASLDPYQQVILEKQTLDVFDNPNTGDLLKLVGPVSNIVVYGVVTEICVNLAVQGLQKRGYPVSLVLDATHHLDEAEGKKTLALVERQGARLVTTAEVTGKNLPSSG